MVEHVVAWDIRLSKLIFLLYKTIFFPSNFPNRTTFYLKMKIYTNFLNLNSNSFHRDNKPITDICIQPNKSSSNYKILPQP